MQQETKSGTTTINWKWVLGLVLTLIVIILQIWTIQLTYQERDQRGTETSKVTGYSTKRLDEMWMKINSLEAIIHTVPLVECGDQHGERRKDSLPIS